MGRPEAGERAHHHVGDAVRDLVVGVDDGRGELGVDDRALRRLDLDGAPAAGVGRDQAVGIDRHLEAAEDARRADRQRRVDGALHLRVGAGEVDQHAVARLGDAHADPERGVLAVGVVGDAVAVAEVLEVALAVGQIGQRGAHQPLGIVHHLGHVGDQAIGAVALGQRLQPLGGAQGGGELGAEVALALVRRAHVGEDHLLQVDVEGRRG